MKRPQGMGSTYPQVGTAGMRDENSMGTTDGNTPDTNSDSGEMGDM